MKVQFTTNIDCCKSFVRKLSEQRELLTGNGVNPAVGDCVLVDRNKHVWLKVVARRWKFEQFGTPVLECELHLDTGWTIPALEKHLNS